MAVEAVLDHAEHRPWYTNYRRPEIKGGWASTTPLSPLVCRVMEHRKLSPRAFLP